MIFSDYFAKLRCFIVCPKINKYGSNSKEKLQKIHRAGFFYGNYSKIKL